MSDEESEWTDETEYETSVAESSKTEEKEFEVVVPKKKAPDVKVCQCVDHFVTGLGAYNTCNARNAVKKLNNTTLWSLKYGWEAWERMNIHSKKFDDVFHVCKLAAACCGTFMTDYFAVPRRFNLRFDDEFNWKTIPKLVDFLVENRDHLVRVAEGEMSVHTFELCNSMIKEAGWTSRRKGVMDVLKKKNEALYWLLIWARGSTFRKFAIERGKVIQGERLRRFASKVSVMFVSKIMKEHTPLYHVSEKSWLTVVDAKEESSSEEEFTDSGSEEDADSDEDDDDDSDGEEGKGE